MEEKSKKKIYFIFSQKAGEIIDYEIEKNEIIDEIKILKQDNTSDYIYKLYSISLNNIPISKSFSILLFAEGQYFIAQIECNKIYQEIFMYKIEFKSMDKNSSVDINQIQDNITKYLLLNSFDIIASANKEKKFDFYFFLFLFGNVLYFYYKNIDKDLLATFFNFFQLDFIDVKNSYKKNYHNNELHEIIGQENIDILNDFNKVYNIIESFSINEDANKKNIIINSLDILLAYYYINYNHKLFFKFLFKNENNQRHQQISDNLKKNRKIFLNFSFDIINYDLLVDAQNLNEIYYVFLLVPNIPELIKIMGENATFIKLCNLCEKEKKVVNVYKIIKPQKEDDIKLLNDYYDILKKQAIQEDFSPHMLYKEIFNEYCELFYYYDTGIYLIKNGKLINKDFLSFIHKVRNKFHKEIKITEELSKGLVPSNDKTFVKELLNNKNSEILCKYYFNNFALKDFANEANAEIFKCDNNLIIKYCYESLKHVWLKENPKVNNILGEFIAHLFTKYFNIYQDQENFDELKKFENELNRNELLMDIYGVIIKRYLIHYYSPKLEKHIYEFIGNHYYEVDIMSIYYSLLIVKPEDKEDY